MALLCMFVAFFCGADQLPAAPLPLFCEPIYFPAIPLEPCAVSSDTVRHDIYSRKVQSSIMITIVTGLPRSGTSLTMQMLKAAGFPVFYNREPNKDQHNPRGYYEVAEFARHSFYTQDNAELLDKQCNGKIVKMFPYCFQALPPCFEYRFIRLHRHIGAIADSQRIMLKRNSTPDTVRESSLHRVQWHSDLLCSLFPNVIVNFDELFTGVGPNKILNFLGHSFGTVSYVSRLAMMHCVDPSLHPTIER